jgi:hypothetical protein
MDAYLFGSITFFDRIDDFGNKDLKTLYFSDETKLPLLSDYFKANCNATDGSHYKNVHAGIRYVPEYHKKTRTVGSGLGLDIIVPLDKDNQSSSSEHFNGSTE